jgi:hypothetical protein
MNLGLKEEEIKRILEKINSLTPEVNDKKINYFSQYIEQRIKNFYKI